ncbi:hypothetical protein EV652_117108 [Kribbella steppae]|uniref:Methyltransferase family protein n=1 Tax=Kribbella steppae TaxID=2512223 RepID=A0A4R2H2U0_9ACTN|nr:hypothetical protein [Kribbella steppae]TCO17655.1 hypothetical protein EV652_117108 [Kribbella steppae]
MSDNQLAIEVVRGEMQPWSDYSGQREAVGGLVLRTLLSDVLLDGARTLVLGPHGADLIEAVLAKSGPTTLLVRSVSDADELSEKFGDRLQVIAGALDGLTAAAATPYDVIVAADGLDRVLGYDSDDLNWQQRLDALAAVMSPRGALVLGLENEFSLTNLLDRRPADQRHGDDEWRPLHDDPSRPVSVAQLAESLGRVGLGTDVAAYAAFSVGETPLALIAADVAAAARQGQLPARIAVEALEASAAVVPQLAPVAEGAEAAARAGLLASTAGGWIVVAGAAPQHAVYAQTPGQEALLTADPEGDGWSVSINGGGTETAGVIFEASLVPATVPGGVTVETQLIRLAAAEDVPGFRDLAGRLGDWVRSQTGSRVLLRWDDVVVDGESFGFGISAWTTAAEETDKDRLAAAWSRFHDRLIGGHRRHPWPPWMVGDDLVAAWVAMSGIEPVGPDTGPDTPSASVEYVARGKELAGALAAAVGIPADASQPPDVRTALADAERAAHEVYELKGQIFGLERTLAFRDKALKIRETRIRELRGQVQRVNAERARLRTSRAYAAVELVRKVAQIRHPRKFAGKVKRRLKNRVGTA